LLFCEEIKNFEPEKLSKKGLEINYDDKFWKRFDFSKIEQIILRLKSQLSLKKLKKAYYEETGNNHGISTFYKVLKTHFKLSFKKIQRKHPYSNTINFFEERFIFLKLLLKLFINNYTIVFIDESCFDFHYDKRKAWDNESNFYFTANMEYGRNLPNNQYLLAATVQEVLYTKHWAGSNNAETYIEFLSELLEKMNKIYKNDFSFVYFFMDASKIHEGHNVYDFCKERGIKILFGVNYYSQYDLCEYFFRAIKIEHYKNVYKSL